MKKHNPSWPQISDHPYKILIIRGSGSGKTNSLLTSQFIIYINYLISQQTDMNKYFLYAKDSYEANHQLLINKVRD